MFWCHLLVEAANPQSLQSV